MLKKSFLTLLITFSTLFTACSSQKDQEDANTILSSNEFVLQSLANKEYAIKKENGGFVLENNQDKILIIDIFATWCPPCQAEAQHLAHLQEKYKDNLVVFGVSVEDGITQQQLEAFRQTYGATYPLVYTSENRRLVDAVAKSLKVGRNFGIPLMAMYKNGHLINYYQGATEEEFIESDIKTALGKH